MFRNGFALLEILIVAAIIAVLVGGGWYVAHLKNDQSAVSAGMSAEEQAQRAVQQFNRQAQNEENIVSSTSIR